MKNFLDSLLGGDRRWLKIVILALLAVIVVFIILTIIFVLNGNSKDALPPSNIQELLNKHFGEEKGIANIYYDPQLTIDMAGTLKMSGAKDLKPIPDDLMKKGKKKDGSDNLLYDDLIVGRIIKYNSDLVSYANFKKKGVFKSLKKGSNAEDFTKKFVKKRKMAYHGLTFGEIVKGSKKYYFALVSENYSTINLETFETKEVTINYVYKLVPNKDTMLIEDIEQVGK